MHKQRNQILSIVCPLLALMAGAAQAQENYNWTSLSDGSWGTNTNWTVNGIPGTNALDTATFNTASTGSIISLDGSRTLDSVSFGDANTSWTINAGSDPASILTVGAGAVKFTVTDTIVNINAAVGAGSGTNEFRTGGDGGTVNFAGNLSTRTLLGSNTTAGTVGMIYNLNAVNIAQSRIIVGFPNGTGGQNTVTGTTLNVNQNQTSGNELRAGGGNNAANAGVIVIRNGATWTQTGDTVHMGFSAGGGGTPTHGRIDVGVAGVGASIGNLIIGNSAFLNVANRAGTGILNINNGTVTVNSNSDTATITLADQAPNSPNPGGNGTINLNASGTLVTARNFTVAANGNGTFNFDGGLLQINRATGNVTTNLFSGGTTILNVQNGGARIDTQANSTVINQALVGVGTGGLEKLGAGTLTLNGNNTFTGNTTVSAGTLTLSNTSEMLFVIGATGVNNSIGGVGTVNLDGVFRFDLSGAAAVGSWNIVNVASLTETYGGTFEVDGFTNNSGTWTSGDYTFVQSTGVLTAIPEPSAFALLSIFGAFVMFQVSRRRRQATLN